MDYKLFVQTHMSQNTYILLIYINLDG